MPNPPVAESVSVKRKAEIERWLRDRMPGQNVRTIEKKSFVAYKGGWVDFPFQKNIHQLLLSLLVFAECWRPDMFSQTRQIVRQSALSPFVQPVIAIA